MTASVNGYFLTTVFMTHLIQYMSWSIYGPLDIMYIEVNRALGQLIVAMFLFYSGYGVMESLRHKNNRDVNPTAFFIAAVIYLFVSCATNQTPTFRYALKGFAAWESLGNSNWYVFAILYLYVVTYIVFRIRETKWFRKMPLWFAVFGIVFLSGIYILWMRHAGKGDIVLQRRHVFCTGA